MISRKHWSKNGRKFVMHCSVFELNEACKESKRDISSEMFFA